MNKQKMNLQSLTVQSFVTTFADGKEALKGGQPDSGAVSACLIYTSCNASNDTDVVIYPDKK